MWAIDGGTCASVRNFRLQNKFTFHENLINKVKKILRQCQKTHYTKHSYSKSRKECMILSCFYVANHGLLSMREQIRVIEFCEVS